MFVHHTAGSNWYSRSDVPRLIRGIYAYHVNGRGWRDIGYNFLIDRFGRIWEGRYGGPARAVVGAHTANYNGNSFGAAAMGSLGSVSPTSALLSAYKRLIAWKFALSGVNPTGRVAYPGQKTLPTISAHRDTKATECPGARLYAQLGNIRSGTKAIMDSTAQSSSLSMILNSQVAVGRRIYGRVRWRTPSWRDVSGWVNLQRRSSSWVHVRQVTVDDGVSWTALTPGGSGTYRVVVDHSSDPLNVEYSGSDLHSVRAWSTASSFRMSGPYRIELGDLARLQISWHMGDQPVTGRAILQKRSGSSWDNIREASIVNGSGVLSFRPGATNVWRLRATSASPSNTPLSHPKGTTDEVLIDVVA
ncbi:MAG: hypothetical protein GEU96_15525 [Propionibacteriales bacterium]|nr:hypothetical protein [Propionibacteriales bacterium]